MRPLASFGLADAVLGKYFFLISYWCLLKVDVESIGVSKSGLGFKIRQSYSEISHFFWLNSCRIDVFRQHRKIQNFKISPVFNIKLLFWSFFIIIKSFLLKTGDILKFWIAKNKSNSQDTFSKFCFEKILTRWR